jgi:hypothetical protein
MMKKATLLLAMMYALTAFGQKSDFLVLKKNGRTVKSYFENSQFTFTTNSRFVKGIITKVSNDSVNMKEFDIRQMPTQFGVYTIDTVGTYRSIFALKDISYIDKERRNFDWQSSGAALLGGGAIITVVGLGTWVFTKPNSRYYASPYLVGSSALLAGIGYLLMKGNSNGFKLGKRYTLEVVPISSSR